MAKVVVFDFLLSLDFPKLNYQSFLTILGEKFSLNLDEYREVNREKGKPIMLEYRDCLADKLKDNIVIGYNIIPKLLKLNIPLHSLKGIIDLTTSNFIKQLVGVESSPSFSILVHRLSDRLEVPKTTIERSVFMMELYQKYKNQLEVIHFV